MGVFIFAFLAYLTLLFLAMQGTAVPAAESDRARYLTTRRVDHVLGVDPQFFHDLRCPGALMPKRLMPTIFPSSPTYCDQICGTPASIATRLRHSLGKTSAR